MFTNKIDSLKPLRLNFLFTPFIDGNGRCTRLLMNLILLQHGYSITIIPIIVRADYINSLKKAQLTNNNQDFINFISCMVFENMKDYLRLIQALK